MERRHDVGCRSARTEHDVEGALPTFPLTVLSVASFLGFGALLVLFGANSSELIESLSLDYADLGLLGSMLSLGLGCGIILAGPIIDRFPRRPLYLAACGIVLLATTTLGPNTSYAALLAHTIAIGFGAGFYETVLNALIVEESSTSAPRRLIFVHSAATLAASVTPLLFAVARTSEGMPWYETFRVVGLAHILLMVGALFVPMRAPRHYRKAKAQMNTAATNNAAAFASFRPKDDRIALAAVCVATFAYVGVESAISLFVVDHASTEFGLDTARAARTISAFWGGLLIGRLAIGFSPRPIGAGILSAFAAVAALLIMAFGGGLIGSPEVAMAGVGFFLGGVFPVMIGLAGIAFPSSAGTAVGLAGGLGSLGGFVVPWLTGRLANGIGLSLALASLGVWLLALAAATAFVRTRTRTPSLSGDSEHGQNGL